MKLHNIRFILDSLQIQYTPKGEHDLILKCVFHEDSNPSCHVSQEKGGIFHCLSCGEGGHLSKYLSKHLGIPEKSVIDLLTETDESVTQFVNQSKVYEWYGTLTKYPAGLLILLSKKGITKATIDTYRLGWDGERFTIPIFDEANNCINVRRWSNTDNTYKYLNLEGFGGNALYPIDAFNSQTIFLVEGEYKALLLRQYGFNAVCSTSGASSWSKEFNKHFTRKKVYVIYDIDSPGRLGANKVCEALHPFALEVYNVLLPLDIKDYPTGDITDFFVKAGKTKADFLLAINEAKKYAPTIEVEKDDTSEPIILPLSDVTKKENSGKLIVTRGLVAGKHVQPFLIPNKYTVSCPKSKDYCVMCPVYREQKEGKDAEFEIPAGSASNLDIINADKGNIKKVLKSHTKIPLSCKEHSFNVKSTQNIEEVRLIPEPSTSEVHDSSMTVTKGYAIGHGIETNQVYTCKGKIYPDPASQHAVLLITKADKTVDNISSFTLDDTLRKNLEIFQPRTWDVDSIHEKLMDVYADYSCNITRIYQRPYLHLAFDSVFHSVLYINYGGKRVKGWVEGILLGDTGTGKTEVSSSLRNFYGVGKLINCETTTTAGLLGGLTTDFSKRMVINWGELVLNDGRAIVLEEASGLKQDALSVLTEVRSSGTITITKVEKMVANARVRMLWISNPRSNRSLYTFNYGVDALRELIGAIEDIRRFDFAMLLSTKDVDSKWLNVNKYDLPTHSHVYTAGLSRALILWAWSRKPEQVILEQDADTEMLKIAEEMSKFYSQEIPIVSQADQRFKLLRIATALAIKTFSIDVNDNVIVRKGHVQYTKVFLEELFKSPACGYYEYSKNAYSRGCNTPIGELQQIILRLPNPKSIVVTMLSSTEISTQALTEWTGLTKEDVSTLIQNLVAAGCLKRIRHYYYKTESFIDVLRGMLRNDTIFDSKPITFGGKTYEF